MKKDSTKLVQEKPLYFFGEYKHSLDSQRRIAIPSLWRNSVGKTRFFLVPGRNRILQLIPFSSFKNFLEKAGKISFANEKAGKALAKFASKVQDSSCDKQGRMAISKRLYEYSGLGQQVLLVGAVTTVQIWDPERWRSENSDDEHCLDEMQRIGESDEDAFSMMKDFFGNKK